MSVHTLLSKAAAALVLCAALHASAASIGFVQFSAGDVKIRNAAGQVRDAVKGATLEEGDTLLTAAGASAQLKMSDGGILAIRPETELKLDTYRYAGKEDGNERAIMSLVKGGFRTITGIIGRSNKQNYTVNTPTATIGIRGTDHEPVVIPAIPVAGQPPAPPGTYDKVNVGQAYIRTPMGEVNIRQNQVGYAAPNQAPTLLPKVPEFFKATPPVKQAQPGQKEEQQKQADQKQGEQKQGEQKQAEQKQAEQKQQTAQAGDKPAETQATQAAAADSGPAPAGSTGTASGTTGEIRSVATIDSTPSTASTGAAATTTAVVPTTPTVTAPATSTTATTAPPAVVQEVKGTSSDTSLSLNLTSQTTTTPSGTTTTITPTPVVTPSQPTTANPTVAASTYSSLVVSQAPVSATTAELEGISSQQRPQTAYVLDTNKALREIQHTGHATTNASGLAQSISDANLKFSGGQAADVYVDETSTFYIGRQEGGSITITDNSGGVAQTTQSLNASSAHWLIGVQPALTALPGGVGSVTAVQNMTGFAHYSLAAATHPTDRQGNIGTLTDALFFADFNAQTIFGELGLKFSTAAGQPASTRDLELFAIAFDVPIKRGGFEAIAGTSTDPIVVCISGDCVERSYRGTIRGMFGASGSSSSGLGSGLGLSYSFGPANHSGTSFDDLIQGTAILTNTEIAPVQGLVPTFPNNANVRHEAVYGTFHVASSLHANLAVARDTMTLSGSGGQLSGPRSNTNYLFDDNGALVRIFDTPYAVFDHGTSLTAAPGSSFVPSGAVSSLASTTTPSFTAPTPLANAQVSFGGVDGTAADLYDNPSIGLRMGRWQGGVVTVVDLATGNGYVEYLDDRSVHWLVRAAPTSVPITGIYHYSRVAATQPTDMYGNVGTLDRARLQVDFGRSTVSAGVAITMPTGFGGSSGTQQLSGYFTDAPLTTAGFNVSSNPADNPANTDRLHVNCFGDGCAANQNYGGRIRGGFTSGAAAANTADGAYFRYTFVTNYADADAASAESRVFDDYIDGFVAFKQGLEIVKPSLDIMGAPTLANPIVKPAGDAAILYAYTFLNGQSFVESRSEDVYSEGGNGYEVGLPGGLVSAKGYFDDDRFISGSNGQSVSPFRVSTGPVNSTFDISYGYYVGPTLAGEDHNGAFTGRQANTFHWVRGPALYPFYASMIAENPGNLSGSVVGYTKLAGTVTDVNGQAGVVNTASLKVNFSGQTVDAAVNATVGTTIFDAAANGIALEDLGSFSAWSGGPVQHNFTDNNGKLTANGSSAFGNLRGTLMGPGAQAAGMVFDFSGPNARATGSVVFGDPKYTGSAGEQAFVLSPLADYRLGMVATGMNQTGALTSFNGGGLLEGENNYRVDLGALPPSRVQFDPQVIDGVITPVLTRFDGIHAFGYGCSAGTCSGTAEIGARYAIAPSVTTSARALEAGYDAETGLRWGRWGGGMVNVAERAGGGTNGVPSADGSTTINQIDVTANNWHYLLTGVQSGPVVLPVSGTANYTLIGHTSPTAYAPGQSVPDVGTLTSATLTANFTNRTVDVAVGLSTPNSGTWAASATNVPILKDTAFHVEKTLGGTGPLAVTRNGATTNTAGQIVGGFAGQSGQGAGIAYSLNQGGPSGTTVSGVAAFKR